jgi:hypothetical protein
VRLSYSIFPTGCGPYVSHSPPTSPQYGHLAKAYFLVDTVLFISQICYIADLATDVTNDF